MKFREENQIKEIRKINQRFIDGFEFVENNDHVSGGFIVTIKFALDNSREIKDAIYEIFRGK